MGVDTCAFRPRPAPGKWAMTACNGDPNDRASWRREPGEAEDAVAGSAPRRPDMAEGPALALEPAPAEGAPSYRSGLDYCPPCGCGTWMLPLSMILALAAGNCANDRLTTMSVGGVLLPSLTSSQKRSTPLPGSAWSSTYIVQLKLPHLRSPHQSSGCPF